MYIYQPAGGTVYKVWWVYLSTGCGYSKQGAVSIFIRLLVLQHKMSGGYIFQPARDTVYKMRWV